MYTPFTSDYKYKWLDVHRNSSWLQLGDMLNVMADKFVYKVHKNYKYYNYKYCLALDDSTL